jgi:hypothetical protein
MIACRESQFFNINPRPIRQITIISFEWCGDALCAANGQVGFNFVCCNLPFIALSAIYSESAQLSSTLRVCLAKFN